MFSCEYKFCIYTVRINIFRYPLLNFFVVSLSWIFGQLDFVVVVEQQLNTEGLFS